MTMTKELDYVNHEIYIFGYLLEHDRYTKSDDFLQFIQVKIIQTTILTMFRIGYTCVQSIFTIRLYLVSQVFLQ